jgi:Cft2 family RNA processing exonuclease
MSDARHIDRLIARGVDLDPVTPLHDHDDVVATLTRMIGLPYHRRQVIAPGVELTFLDAGHVLGSAIVVLDVDDGGTRVRIAFTGDLGRPNMPILRDPEIPESVDYLITESTYGDRRHAPIADARDELAAVISRTAARGGKLVIPAFALERAQEIIFALGRLRSRGAVPTVPIYVDSPLATKLTGVFRLHPDCYDHDAFAQLQTGSLFEFDGLRYVTDAEDSKAIDTAPGPAIVIAGSGLCEGGRVLHHLRVLVSDPRNTVAIVSFQAEHTLGRRIAERRRQVKIFGMMHDLHAEVVVFDGFSAHADQAGLIEFAKPCAGASGRERSAACSWSMASHPPRRRSQRSSSRAASRALPRRRAIAPSSPQPDCVHCADATHGAAFASSTTPSRRARRATRRRSCLRGRQIQRGRRDLNAAATRVNSKRTAPVRWSDRDYSKRHAGEPAGHRRIRSGDHDRKHHSAGVLHQ